jgi:ubiquinone/menaquinone biosynthesis C-methylase UbiE
MKDAKHDGHLGAVYGAKTPLQVAAIYDQWAATYDSEMLVAGYRHPSICLALLARYLPHGTAPVLDAGAGTGLIGEWLGIVGYPTVEALDISEGMLAVAAKKNIYTKLHQLALGGPLPFVDHAFAGIVSTGVFTTGHVGAEALDELIRICQVGGSIVLTVKDTIWHAGFRQAVQELTKMGRVELAEETKPYISMPGEAGTVPSRAIVLTVLK